jgi:hypothetical protein
MDRKNKRELEAVYLQTNYIIRDEEKEIIIRIGESNAALEELLKRYKSETWAFLTACNPFSEPFSARENEVRQMNLLKQLKERSFQFLHGRGEAVSGDWAAELSAFIFNIDRETAINLGSEFEQNAIVIGSIGSVPELVWCEIIE